MDIPERFEDWQIRIKEERDELLQRTIRLKKFMDSPNTKLNSREWEMLMGQLHAMVEYLQALTDRCVYYELIESGDLGIHY